MLACCDMSECIVRSHRLFYCGKRTQISLVGFVVSVAPEAVLYTDD